MYWIPLYTQTNTNNIYKTLSLLKITGTEHGSYADSFHAEHTQIRLTSAFEVHCMDTFFCYISEFSVSDCCLTSNEQFSR